MRKYFFALAIAVVSFLSMGSHAIAACTAPTIGSNLVLRFPSAEGVWAGAASSIRAEDNVNTALNTAGVLYYDTTSNNLKLCDGTDWVTLGAGGGGGGGSATFAGLTDVDVTGVINGQTIVYDSAAGKWVPGTASGGGGSGGATLNLGPAITANMTANQILVNNCEFASQPTLTIPKTGLYYAAVQGYGYKYSGNIVTLSLYLETSASAQVFGGSVGTSGTGSHYLYVDKTGLVELSAGTYTFKGYANNGGNCSTTSWDRLMNAYITVREVIGSGGGGAADLADLGDVDVDGATAGQSLVFNGTKWEPQTITGGSGGAGTPLATGMAWRTAGGVASNNVYADVPLNAGNANLIGITHSTSSNPARMTVTKKGKYLASYSITGVIRTDGAATFSALLAVNGAPVPGTSSSLANDPGWSSNVSSTAILDLNAGAYVSLQAMQNAANGTYNSATLVLTEIGASGGGGASALADLTDVDVTGATNGQALVYNATTSTWEPRNVSAGGGAGGQPYAFYAYYTATGPNNQANMVFPATTVNTENVYNTANGKFKAPVAGIYYFAWGGIGSSATGVHRYNLLKNGAQLDNAPQARINNTAAGEFGNASRQIYLELVAGDEISVYYTRDVGTAPSYGAGYDYFSGNLVTAGGGASDLADLGDVDVAGVLAGQALVYNGTKWEPGPFAAGGASPATGFAASATASIQTTLQPITGYTTTYNSGSGFNPTTGVFTAPKAGLYALTANIMLTSSLNNAVDLEVSANTEIVCRSFRGTTPAGNYFHNCSGMVNMAMGDTAILRARNSGGVTSAEVLFTGAYQAGGASAGSQTLSDLTDVSVTGATSGQSLVFNGTTWVPQTITGGTGTGGPAVAFWAQGSTTSVPSNVSTWTKIIYPTVNNQVGGNNYNAATGVFTTPTAGWYSFSATGNMYNANSVGGIEIAVLPVGRAICRQMSQMSTVGGISSCNGIAYLAAGVDVIVRGMHEHGATTTLPGSDQNMFSGFLISGGGSADSLSDLTDVDVTGAINGQALVYNSATNTWVPGDASSLPSGTVAMSVNRNGVNQTVGNNAITPVTWTTKAFDTDNSFDLSTGRFQPKVAGYYALMASIHCSGTGTSSQFTIFKNGTQSIITGYQNTANALPNASGLVYMNGTTDYLTLTAICTGSTTIYGEARTTYWSAALISGSGSGSGAESLSDLGDVDVTGATTGQSLVFNGTTWEPQTITGGSGASTPLATGMAWRTSQAPISDSVYANVPLDAGNANLLGVTHSTSSNPARMTVAKAGKYLVNYTLMGYIRPVTAATIFGRLAVNDVEIPGTVSTNANDGGYSVSISGSAVVTLSAGDYVTLQAMQDGPNGLYAHASLTIVEIGASGGSGAESLADLTDVSITGASSGQSLVFNGTRWEPQTVTGGTGGSGITPAAFKVGRNGVNLTVTTNTWIPMVWTQKEFDVSNAFNLSSGRFQPTQAGYYQLNLSVYCPLGGSTECQGSIYKNGIRYAEGYDNGSNGMGEVSVVTYLNGTSDYVQAYVYNYNGTVVSGADMYTNFSGALLTGGGSGSGAETLADLTDVDLSGATAGQALVFNGTTWEPSTVSSAVGGTPVVSQAVTGSQSTTSNSPVDLPGMTTTFTSAGGPTLLLANFTSYVNSASATGHFRLLLNGTQQDLKILQYVSSSDVKPTVLSAVVDLPAGSHTVKVQWQTSAGTLVAGWSDGNNRIFAIGLAGSGVSGGSSQWDDVSSGVIRYDGTSVLVGQGTAANTPSNTTPTVHANGDGYLWMARNHPSGFGLLYLQNLKSGSGEFASFISGTTPVGAITTNGTGTAYNTTSDARLKENVTDSERGLDTLMRIDVKDFNFISDEAKTRVQGFIAQQLNTVYPEAVTPGDNEKSWNVDYGRITPLIVKSIQDLKTENDELKHQVNDMQQQIDALKAAIEALQAKE